MAIDCDKKPCNDDGCKCETKKKQFEKCCENCTCMPTEEYDKLKKEYANKNPKKIAAAKNEFDDKENANGVKPKVFQYKFTQDKDFVAELVNKQYDPQASSTKCKNGQTRAKCQKKSKCVLRKFSETKEGKNNKCCPGQTGHHVIPDSVFTSNTSACRSHSMSLTVCVAGSSNYVGTHGLMHSATKHTYMKLCKSKKDSKASYRQIRDASLEAFGEVFSSSDCDLVCMKKDLDKSYKEISDKKNECKNPKKEKYSCKKYGSAAKEKENKKALNKIAEKIGTMFRVS